MREPSAAVQEALAITAEICGAEISIGAARVMMDELAGFAEHAVLSALARVRREHSGRLTLASIIQRIDDGRPGPEEAWAICPKSEYETAVLTEEIRRALSIAQHLLDERDEIAARMAFREAYQREVAAARAAGIGVQWSPSPGFDAAGRARVLGDAVRSGKISLQLALQFVDDRFSDDLRGIAQGPARISGSNTNGRVTKLVTSVAEVWKDGCRDANRTAA